MGAAARTLAERLQTLNAIGIDIRNLGGGAVAPNSLTTHRFGYYQGTSYITGLVYQDLNGNGDYDPGEGLNGKINYSYTYVQGGLQIGGGGIAQLLTRLSPQPQAFK